MTAVLELDALTKDYEIGFWRKRPVRALDSLSRLLEKPEPQGDGTLEGLVSEMLRPMLKEWLDANLPDMVEAMVSREIARISGQGR